MSKKSKFGQFFTTRSTYILQGMYIPTEVKTVVEPFTGNGDLVNFIRIFPYKRIECYDIDPKTDDTVQRDTIKNPPSYKNKFVVTNPPYLARNKSKDKSIYDLYKCNDLYKCFLGTLINSDGCKGGIIIIPLNFLSSIRKADAVLRKEFLNVFDIVKVNIFEERVFDDTSYAVCSIMFNASDKGAQKSVSFDATIFPSERKIKLTMNKDNNYTIGGEIYKLRGKTYKVSRATSKTDNSNISNILLKCIDDSNTKRLGLSVVSDDIVDKYIDRTPKLTARSYASINITPPLDIKEQKKLVKRFNDFVDENREKYNSLFLTQYRDSNTIARKRVSFKLAFDICGYLLES